jgi:hypothetical protein
MTCLILSSFAVCSPLVGDEILIMSSVCVNSPAPFFSAALRNLLKNKRLWCEKNWKPEKLDSHFPRRIGQLQLGQT